MNIWRSTFFTCCLAVLLTSGGRSLAADELFRNHGLPPGSATEILPQGPIVHVQLNNVFQSALNLEKLLVATVPAKLAPPPVQELLQSEHPLMTALGMNIFQAPLSTENLAQNFGIDTAAPVSLTLYPGDPRRLFILSVPMANGPALAQFAREALQAGDAEEISLDGKPAVRFPVNLPQWSTDLYVVCNEKTAYFCGDRSLALALHKMPSSQRMGKDAYFQRVLPTVAAKDLAIVFNPVLIKPLALQMQQLPAIAFPLLHQQRERLLREIPPPAREQFEMQLRTQMGVPDLETFANYVECVIKATVELLVDRLSGRLIAFEGLAVAVQLDPKFPEFTAYAYSHTYQPDQGTKPIPLNEVRQAMDWLGDRFQSFSLTGQTPPSQVAPWFTAWLAAVRKQFEAQGLKSVYFDQLAKLMEDQRVSPPVAARVPWMLTTRAPFNPPPSIDAEPDWMRFAEGLAPSVGYPIRLVPAKDLDFLEQCFREETDVLNHNTRTSRDFITRFTQRAPWLQQTSRMTTSDCDGGLRQFTLENAYITPAGIFGYDQHEFINRRTYLARTLDGYLVYHQGARQPQWLKGWASPSGAHMAPGVKKLLDRVPEGANHVQITRALHGLPLTIDWLAAVEDRIHADLRGYLQHASQAMENASNPEEALAKAKAVPMPELVYTLNREAQTGRLYCLLPGKVVFPRPKVVPVLQQLLAAYAAQAPELGGSLFYTRVQPETYQVSLSQSTEALSFLIQSVGNALAENYLSSPEKMQQLQQRIVTQRDQDPDRLEEVLINNPRWGFLPQTPKVRTAPATKAVAPRDPAAGPNLIDLTPYYNANPNTTWQEGGTANNTLAQLPQGLHSFGGVQFDVRGIIQLNGQSAQESLTIRFPQAMKGIKVERTARQLHFLHATAWPESDGTRIGTYVVHYADGESEEIPIVYGRHVRDWWTQNDEISSSELNVVWTGKNQSSQDGKPAIRLFKTTWENPRPDARITAVDYLSTMSQSAPFMIALTVTP